MIVQSLLGHKVAAAALALTLGGTSAAAATGNLPIVQDDPVELTEDSTTDVEIEVEADEAVSEDEPKEKVLPPVNADGVEYGDVACSDAVNHGEYVSGVAKDDTIEGNRGEIVSQAAKTNCGKADKDEAKAERNAAKAVEKAERDAAKAERKAEDPDVDGDDADVDGDDADVDGDEAEDAESDDSDSDEGAKKDKPIKGNGKKN